MSPVPHGLNGGSRLGKEDLADGISDKTVNAKIEPLHGVAKGCGRYGLLDFFVIDDGHVVNAQRAGLNLIVQLSSP